MKNSNLKILSKALLFAFLLSFCQSLFAQNKYWVFFTDKDGESFNPYEYFDIKAIDRRIQNGISLFDKTDFPVKEEYISKISEKVDSISNHSRWFNALAVYANENQIQEILAFPFVENVEQMDYYPVLAYYQADFDTTLKSKQLKILNRQTETMGRKYFEAKGIDGKGIRIAVFDGGFPTFTENPALQHIVKGKRLIKTWDFTRNKENVFHGVSHGVMVTSCIGGIINGKKIGLATGAEFLLAKTEVRTEPFSEEENWLAAVEWADKNGADIINSSLGYIHQRYFPEQMDGKKSLVSRAANLAAKKGILVINAAGNEGSSKWKIIGAPADADSIISVGGINPSTNYHTSFSSYGPTADKRLKPNVCAFGHVIAAGKKGLKSTQGTSFSSPLVAGFAACAWQMNRDKNNMEMFSEIQKSGNLYPYFDYAHGYGVPQAKYFTGDNVEILPTFDFIEEDSIVKVVIKDEFFKNNNYDNSSVLYYNIQNKNGCLEKYFIISVDESEVLKININDYNDGKKLNVHYLNYTETFEF